MLPLDKIKSIARRFEEVDELLYRPEVAADVERLTKLTKERGELEPLVLAYEEYTKTQDDLEQAKESLRDPELKELAKEEIPELEAKIEELEATLQQLLLPKDPNDLRDTLLEIRAGTGGEEAALFAADLFRMYSRYAETVGWKIEVLSQSSASAGGIKEVIALVKGKKVYSALRFEGGVHRVQRVPSTESQGRIHTSTATVAVMPEADDVEIDVDEKDLKITKTAAGGAGGQKVNTTNSAINLLHIPTGIQIRSESERSQHQNLAQAMKILKTRLLELKQAEQDAAIRDERRGMVGTGERSEKIRTYNYPQNRVTDHRIGLTLHSLDKIVEGSLGDLMSALRAEHQAKLLEAESSRGHH